MGQKDNHSVSTFVGKVSLDNFKLRYNLKN